MTPGEIVSVAAWPANATSAPAVVLASHGIVPQIMIAVVGGLVAVVGAMAAQSARDRARERGQMRRAAGTLGIEIAAIAESIGRAGLIRPGMSALYEGRPIPRGAYDGIVSSGVLGRFDLQVQELLYRFYWRASIGDRAGMDAMIDEVAAEVDRIRLDNAPGLRAALGRMLRRAPKRKGAEAAPGRAGAAAQGSVGAPIRGRGP